MLTLARHALSILLLPFVVVVAVPAWLLGAFAAADSRWDAGSPIGVLAGLAGGVLVMVGLLLFSWCVGLFARIGRGTLAPWDPTRAMVAIGPYRFVRNPMISGVALVLGGRAVLLGSWVMVVWTGLFVLINHVYFVLAEEPGLERRFGEPYRLYKANVPRWLPRLRPGTGAWR